MENRRIQDETLKAANEDGYFAKYPFYKALDEYAENTIDQTLSLNKSSSECSE
ncbi:hypothetical protein [Bacillus swezeyi]|uniref:hypothetical protein n=1 Tax=Bacillus swezeyi TaxID=1925020 RepID=UPI0027DC1E7E|nr:hypothetical protein [Bacillus swezeyi]